MSSTRLPGKIMAHAGGKSLLSHHWDRLKQSGLEIIVATTDEQPEDCIADWCSDQSTPCFRGSRDDVLSRYYHCAKEFQLRHIIRVTTDCPLIDGLLIKDHASRYLALGRDDTYYSNVIRRTYPRGMDFEIFSFELLEKSYQSALDSQAREHVTTYMHRGISRELKKVSVTHKEDFSHLRLTVDEEDDLKLIRLLIDKHNCHHMSWEEIASLLSQHPSLMKINAHIVQKK